MFDYIITTIFELTYLIELLLKYIFSSICSTVKFFYDCTLGTLLSYNLADTVIYYSFFYSFLLYVSFGLERSLYWDRFTSNLIQFFFYKPLFNYLIKLINKNKLQKRPAMNSESYLPCNDLMTLKQYIYNMEFVEKSNFFLPINLLNKLLLNKNIWEKTLINAHALAHAECLFLPYNKDIVFNYIPESNENLFSDLHAYLPESSIFLKLQSLYSSTRFNNICDYKDFSFFFFYSLFFQIHSHNIYYQRLLFVYMKTIFVNNLILYVTVVTLLTFALTDVFFFYAFFLIIFISLFEIAVDTETTDASPEELSSIFFVPDWDETDMAFEASDTPMDYFGILSAAEYYQKYYITDLSLDDQVELYLDAYTFYLLEADDDFVLEKEVHEAYPNTFIESPEQNLEIGSTRYSGITNYYSVDELPFV